jgi:hypothetical protein
MKQPPPTGKNSVAFVKRLLIMSDPLKPLFGGPGGALDQLARRAAEVDALTALVRRSLPDPLGPHVTASTRHGDDLVVTVDSASWTARVRYGSATLRERLAAAGQPVTGRIRVRVGRPLA